MANAFSPPIPHCTELKPILVGANIYKRLMVGANHHDNLCISALSFNSLVFTIQKLDWKILMDRMV